MKCLLFAILLCLSFFSFAQADKYVKINQIIIQGNNRTNERLILRELCFNSGDSIEERKIFSRIATCENQLFNTGLFLNVEIILFNWQKGFVDAEVTVKERWYLFPFPILELADRNFNVWWEEMGRDLNRIDYGIRLRHFNLTGNGDELKVVLQSGFTRKYELFYTTPFLNKMQSLRIQPFIHFSKNKQIAYKTFSNKLLFYEHPDFVRERFYTGTSFLYRRKNNFQQIFTVEFNQNIIDDTIASLNDKYFLENKLHQRFLEVSYTWEADFRDIRYYPLKGYYLAIEANKKGLGIFDDINMLSFTATAKKYMAFGEDIFLATEISGKTSAPTTQPYYNQEALGYQTNLVRGYELYVIDGQHYGLFKASLKYQLLSRNNILLMKKLSKFGKIPLGLYPKLFLDMGYVKDQFYFVNNSLNNKFLIGGGAGLDIVSYYDLVFRIEFTVNKLLEKGVFLHFMIDI